MLQEMVKVCQRYGEKHNMIFSTDPVPARSKTKCIYFDGNNQVHQHPAPVLLEGRELPWVESALHLGHTLHQSGSMEKDCKIHRAVFIDRSVEVREQLHFGDTKEVLKAINVYCCDGYGPMLWRLNSDTSEMYFKA